MTRYTRLFHHVLHLAGTLLTLLLDVARFLRLCLRPAPVLAAENLFLRKQLACYQERHVTPRRVTDAGRFILVWLARWFDWRQALVIVQSQTFTRWHRQGFRLFWRWKSRPGRPPIPADLQVLIRRMARENPSWGEARIANELLANALCERLLGTLRRECLDYLIPLSENHLRGLLAQWVPHDNTGRPHMSLGPGIPQPPPPLPVPLHVHRHQLPDHLWVVTRPILGGLHHEYRLAKVA